MAAIADARPERGRRGARGADRAGGDPPAAGHAVVRAFGRGEVRGAVVADLDPGGRWIAGTERGLDCDLVAVSGGTVPSTSLLLQAGAKARWDEARGAYLPEGAPPGIFAAGAVAGHGSAELAELSGAVAGAEAAISLELGGDGDRERLAPRARAAERGGAARGRGRPGGSVRRRPAATASASPACART